MMEVKKTKYDRTIRDTHVSDEAGYILHHSISGRVVLHEVHGARYGHT